MAIVLPGGFLITNNEPADARISVANQAARLGFSINNVYPGLVVYQQDTQELYVLTDASNPSQLSSWTTISGVDTSIFAITGSNIFKGDQTITGSLFITGSINLFDGKLLGTSSYSDTASYVNPLYQTVFITGALEINQTGTSALNINSSSINIFSVSDGITKFGQLNYIPTSTPGGIYFDGSDFFLGF
jgi:hypothetical protein